MKANMNDQKRFNKDSFEINELAREKLWVSAY
jgi:hypothetical protein